jgi:Na+/H+ antiporter NhaD/arsenite permease-like protein
LIELAWISLAALLFVVVLSCTTAANPGLVALVLAWTIAIYVAPIWGRHFTPGEVLAGFPTELFLTLLGVTLLFTMARVNGSLDQVVHIAVRGCRGNTGLIPPLFFGLGLVVASIGAGNVAAAALVAPLAMSVAARTQISPILMTIMVGHGCTAGALSPIAPTGIIASGIMARFGMSGFERQSYLYNLLANALAAATAYLMFGGWRLLRKSRDDADGTPIDVGPTATMTTGQKTTLSTIALLVVAVLALHVQVGMGAFAAVVLLTLAKAADEKSALLAMPWGVILMVCGVTVLTSMLEKTGGIDLFTSIVARLATHRTVTGLMALVTGLVSVYSSTSGVVLPAFLPSVPGLVAKLGGGNPLAIASSILIGGHLVDVSPLSTIGAICIAAAPASADRRLLFNQVLAWGLSMAVAGALGCNLAFAAW